MLKEIGDRIKSLRKKLGMTLKKLEYKSGIGYVTLSRIEAGKRDPTVMELKKISDALEKNILYFFITNDEIRKNINYPRFKK
jgi:transcriptional regulator with XRE-family HTH domain